MADKKDKDDLDGCELEFDPASDEETEKLLVPKGKEQKSWTEKEEASRRGT